MVGEHEPDGFGKLQPAYFSDRRPYLGIYFDQRNDHDLLFSADSVFAGGTLSYIAESGTVGDYIDSLTRLRYFGLQALYPAHGKNRQHRLKISILRSPMRKTFLLPKSLAVPNFCQKFDEY
jgi:hypothetical protein